jgi:hypothetical protein
MPSSPRGWVSWASFVLTCRSSPGRVRYDNVPRPDPRMNDSRETAISVLRLLEQSSNGAGGAGLTFDFYTGEMSWHSFTKQEQRIISRTAREFAKRLREAGFLAAGDS